jgi:Flp pilus assembly protein TadG
MTMCIRLSHRRVQAAKGRKRERGTSAVEFALIMPVFLLLIIGVAELSRAIWIYGTVAHAAREGTRYAMVRGAENKQPATAVDVETYVQERAGYGSSTQVITTWQPDNKPGSIVQVSVQYEFKSVASLLPIGPLALSSSSRMVIAH